MFIIYSVFLTFSCCFTLLYVRHLLLYRILCVMSFFVTCVVLHYRAAFLPCCLLSPSVCVLAVVRRVRVAVCVCVCVSSSIPHAPHVHTKECISHYVIKAANVVYRSRKLGTTFKFIDFLQWRSWT